MDPIGTQKTTLVEVNGIEYTALMTTVEGGLDVTCPDLPAVSAFGATKPAALAAFIAAIETYLADQ
jgi:predicted RNase H-like HicB family nuclease